MKASTILAFFFGLTSAGVTRAPDGLEAHIDQLDSDIKSTNAAPLRRSSQNGPESSSAPKDRRMLAKRALKTQKSAPWGLRAVSHRRAGAFYEKFPPDPASKYYYDDRAGLGTYAYILDGGIRTTHGEFEGRAETVFTLYPGDEIDHRGHGTGVAGVLGSKTYGVAKRAKLLSVKTLDEEGGCTASAALRALSWTAEHILRNGRQHSSVINLSFGVKKVQSLNTFIEALISEADVPVVTAAGNENEDASISTPGSAKGVINVGHMNKHWVLSPKSNWGPSVTMLAPGVDVECPSSGSDTNVILQSGSSFAAPHVAGLVLNAISVHGIKGATKIKQFLLQSATRDQACTYHNTPNIVANNGNTVQKKHTKPRNC
ncbi:subtilisin-like protease PR1E [Metarhizium acridum CQMa 102]|uniref:Subtilisin-like protease PR1E n=1 Tax=Metarhizium acridum (strain CQMa 102) TaxID=655827 RepID=E9E3R3_METAQ|nr:subtilisin-like protease PR1E [Metarhizium acridum CQMa 102]EFY89488.1 subtilisin-like protease PR1E [Metarhizium acridum CQMa 102]